MQKYFYIIVLLVTTYGCTSNTILKKPKDLISKDEMVNLLTDLYIATAAKPLKNNQEIKNVNYTHLVFEKYGIDSARFRTSNYYYTSRIDEYEAIYKEVEARLTELHTKYEKIQKIKDSIRKDSILKLKNIDPQSLEDMTMLDEDISDL